MREPSLRARLALWYAGALTLALVVVALAAYGLVARTTLAEVDRSLAEAASALAGALDHERLENAERHTLAEGVAQQFHFQDLAVAIHDPATRSWYRGVSESVGARAASAQPPLPPSDRARPGARAYTMADGAWRELLRPYALGPDTLVLATARSLRARTLLLHRIQIAFAIGMPVLLVLATGGGYLLAGAALRPIAEMTGQAARIGASNLHERLPVPHERDELGRLARVFNDLLSRLDAAFTQQRQFMADASHELRTPVAIVSGEAELALSRPDRTAEELRMALTTIGGEAARLTRVVNELFLLARAETGEQLVAVTDLYLADVSQECVLATRSLAAVKAIHLAYDGEDELPLRADDALLRRMLMNLLDNAVKHTPAGGAVSLSARRSGEAYVVEVADTGPGIPAELQSRVFDRFFRASNGSTDPAGAGLGLAIARRVAELHGGALTLARSGARGSVFRVTLPAPPLPASPQPPHGLVLTSPVGVAAG
jgi:heavy metal sensor kinase